MSNLYIILYNIKLWYILNYCSLGFPHNGPNKNPYGALWNHIPALIFRSSARADKTRNKSPIFISQVHFHSRILLLSFPVFLCISLSHDRFYIFVFFSEFSTFLVLFFCYWRMNPSEWNKIVMAEWLQYEIKDFCFIGS